MTFIPNIKPISDSGNYSGELKNVAVGSPACLTENGQECYAIVDIKEQENYEKVKAILQRMCELEKGRKLGEENRCFFDNDVRVYFKAKGE